MATVDKWVDRARTLYWTDTSQYDDTEALIDLNVIVHQIEDHITSEIWEGFFWDIMTADTTVVNQSEYRIPTISSGSFNGVPKIEWISIQYTSWWDFIPATEVNRQTLLQDHDLTWYETNQSTWDPIYFIADDSYFIYPYPKEAVSGWIKLYGIKSLADITLSTNEEDIFWWKIPLKYYWMITDWLEQFIREIKWEKNLAIQARNRFELQTLPSLVEKLWNRRQWISQRWTPTRQLSKYK